MLTDEKKSALVMEALCASSIKNPKDIYGDIEEMAEEELDLIVDQMSESMYRLAVIRSILKFSTIYTDLKLKRLL